MVGDCGLPQLISSAVIAIITNAGTDRVMSATFSHTAGAQRSVLIRAHILAHLVHRHIGQLADSGIGQVSDFPSQMEKRISGS
jgi:hypothetical protein